MSSAVTAVRRLRSEQQNFNNGVLAGHRTQYRRYRENLPTAAHLCQVGGYLAS